MLGVQAPPAESPGFMFPISLFLPYLSPLVCSLCYPFFIRFSEAIFGVLDGDFLDLLQGDQICDFVKAIYLDVSFVCISFESEACNQRKKSPGSFCYLSSELI